MWSHAVFSPIGFCEWHPILMQLSGWKSRSALLQIFLRVCSTIRIGGCAMRWRAGSPLSKVIELLNDDDLLVREMVLARLVCEQEPRRGISV